MHFKVITKNFALNIFGLFNYIIINISSFFKLMFISKKFSIKVFSSNSNFSYLNNFIISLFF